jgi:mono/diheme cytochrome c family protein
MNSSTKSRAVSLGTVVWSMRILTLLLLLTGACSAVASQEGPLVWDSIKKDYTAEKGDISAHLFFIATNISAGTITVDDVKTSCGCTAARLPSRPWVLAPGQSGRVDVAVDLRGKTGTLIKTVMVRFGNTTMELLIEVTIPPGWTNGLAPEMADRLWNMEVAKTDRQAVFRNDCAKCHLIPAFGKSGEQLFHVACGICHESPHRASMVPDLATLKKEVPDNYWREIVAHGKAGTLMPGFAARDGGPLSEPQISSLVDYLQTHFPEVKKSEPPEDD